MSGWKKFLMSAAGGAETAWYAITTTSSVAHNYSTRGACCDPVGPDGTVYVTTMVGGNYYTYLYAFDPDDGSLKYDRRYRINNDDNGGWAAGASDNAGRLFHYNRASGIGYFSLTDGDMNAAFKLGNSAYNQYWALGQTHIHPDGTWCTANELNASSASNQSGGKTSTLIMGSNSGSFTEHYIAHNTNAEWYPNSAYKDSSDNVYMGGGVNSSSYGPWIAKWNSSGTLQWQKDFSGVSGDYFGVATITSDEDDNIYYSQVEGANGYQAVITKLNSSGVVQWAKYFYPPDGFFYYSGRGTQVQVRYRNGRLFVGCEKKNKTSQSRYHAAFFEVDPSDGSMVTGDLYEVIQNLGHNDQQYALASFGLTDSSIVYYGRQGNGTNRIVVAKFPMDFSLTGTYGSGATELILQINSTNIDSGSYWANQGMGNARGNMKTGGNRNSSAGGVGITIDEAFNETLVANSVLT